uniref:Uncharacterized protein n=1 Tax=Phasianus colchicus TaxID=9054 RepID=A0A669QAG7_PHACC
MGFWRESAQQKALERKLLDLWLINHCKHSVLIVSMWEQELRKAAVEIQNGL